MLSTRILGGAQIRVAGAKPNPENPVNLRPNYYFRIFWEMTTVEVLILFNLIVVVKDEQKKAPHDRNIRHVEYAGSHKPDAHVHEINNVAVVENPVIQVPQAAADNEGKGGYLPGTQFPGNQYIDQNA